VNILLDTHVALWAITDSPKLSQAALRLIESTQTNVWISAVNIWEIAIKHSLERGDMPISGHDAMCYFQKSGYFFCRSNRNTLRQLRIYLPITKIHSIGCW
jgi:PIN domain nuclease of toxin-antitoxin system